MAIVAALAPARTARSALQWADGLGNCALLTMHTPPCSVGCVTWRELVVNNLFLLFDEQEETILLSDREASRPS